MERSDPNITERLKKLPPYDDVVEEAPQSEPEAVVEDQEDLQVQETEEVVEENVETLEEPVIETTNDRTKQQFNKVLDHNKNLKEENEQLKKEIRKNVVESLRPEPALSSYSFQQPEPQVQIDQFADLIDNDEYVNTAKLKEMARMTQEANERAKRAEVMAQEAERKRMQDKRDFEETQQMREIHQQFPEIDPNGENFDETLFDAVRNELVSQYTRGENDIYNAVKKWHGILIKPMNKKETEKKAEQKSQILSTTPNSNKQPVKVDLEALRVGTMKGTKGSLAERLRRSGY